MPESPKPSMANKANWTTAVLALCAIGMLLFNVWVPAQHQARRGHIAL
jgi:hypothetical protein